MRYYSVILNGIQLPKKVLNVQNILTQISTSKEINFQGLSPNLFKKKKTDYIGMSILEFTKILPSIDKNIN